MISRRNKIERAKKLAFWKPHITAWHQSDLSATTYCREHGLPLHKFKYWRYQIGKTNLSDQQDTTITEKPISPFVEITQKPQVLTVATEPLSFNVETAHGFSIVIQGETSVKALKNVFMALKAVT